MTLNQYEAMFIFDPTFGSSFENCEAEVRRLMDRADAEILLCRKWDERRLAYRIKGRKRGVYVLVYFTAPPTKIAPLERDARLSEDILRALVLRADGMNRDAMERAVAGEAQPVGDERGTRKTPAEAETKSATEGTEEKTQAVATETAVRDLLDDEAVAETGATLTE